MHPNMTGGLVSKINPLSDAHKGLGKDIVLMFYGVSIANDGTDKSIQSLFFLLNSVCYLLFLEGCVSCQ